MRRIGRGSYFHKVSSKIKYLSKTNMNRASVFPSSSETERNKPDTPLFSSSCFHYFKVFLIFNYIFLLVPFRFTKKEEFYYVYTNKVHKVCSLLIMSLTAIFSVFAIRQATVYKIEDKPQLLFVIAYVATNSAYCFVTLYIYWFKRSCFENILKMCQNDVGIPSQSLRNTVIATILCFVVLIKAIIFCIVSIFFSKVSTWEYVKELTSRYLRCFFVTANQTELSDREMSIPLRTFGSFVTVFEVYWHIANSFALLFCMFSAIQIYLIAKDFNKFLLSAPPIREGDHSADSRKIEKVAAYYFYASDLISQFSEVCGPVLIVLLLEAVPFLSINFVVFFDTTDQFKRVNVTYSIIFYLSILLIAANGTHKMQQFKSWLSEWCRTVDNEKESFRLVFLSAEVSATNIGLSGCGFFTVTYEFVGAMISVFVTYLIILVQFK